MTPHWIFREPSFALALPVYLVAALVFPLHLGWTGASWLAFAGYIVIAAGLLSTANLLARPADHPGWTAALPQSLLGLAALALPAALAFGIGTLAGPVDEAFDEEMCASRGAAESDTAEVESDDTFDVTPDCIAGP